MAALDRIARGVRAHRQTVATDAGVTVLQADLLRALHHGPPPPALAGPLAADLGVSQPTVSDSLAALERKGLVERRSTPGDRRRSTFALTPDGDRLAGGLRRADDVLADTVAVLDPDDQEHVLRGLLDMITGMLDNRILAVARTCPTCRYFEAGTDGPRCSLLQVPLAPGDLRVDCPDHEPV